MRRRSCCIGRKVREGYGARETTYVFQARARRPADRTPAPRTALRVRAFSTALAQVAATIRWYSGAPPPAGLALHLQPPSARRDAE
eukprot:9283237-Alexandrium_andersonii.AAC.1